ncbi:MAG: diguanylate cyclase [Deltaproteobacteria bacterium]|nr:diguanylate cyclase [Deltaproteobacteria bacterium]
MENFPQKPPIAAIESIPLIYDPAHQFGIRVVLGIFTGSYFYFIPISGLAMERGWIFFMVFAYLLYHVTAWRFYKKKGASPLGVRTGNWVDLLGSGMVVIVDPYSMPPTLMLLLIVILGNGIQHGLDNFTIGVRKGILIGFLCVVLHFLLQTRLPPYPFYAYAVFVLACIFYSYVLVRRVETLKEKAESLAQTDELTGLMNRRAFLQAADYLLSLHERMPLILVVVFVDLDGFKKINDTLGHDMGDRVLCKFAELVKTSFRKTDIISRYGGDEFAFILMDNNIENAGMVMRRLEGRFSDWGKENKINLGISWGMKALEKGRNDIDEILRHADAALYKEKTRKKAGSAKSPSAALHSS